MSIPNIRGSLNASPPACPSVARGAKGGHAQDISRVELEIFPCGEGMRTLSLFLGG